MLKLDKKDYLLLSVLDDNSRQPIQQIAKRIGLSKDAVSYRINKLQEFGLIKSFHAVINVGHLGYIGFRFMFKFFHLSPEKETEIINYLLSNKNLNWLVSVEGEWDLNTYFYYSTISEMNTFYETFLERYQNFIEKKHFSIYTKINYLSRNYLSPSTKKTKITAYSQSEKIYLDNQDFIILHELSQNSRISLLELSKKTHLTTKTTLKKIRFLEHNEIITGYKIELDLEKLGYHYYKLHLTLFNSSPEKVRQLRSYLSNHPNVIYEDFVLGGFDLEYELQLKTEHELRQFLNKLRLHFSPIIKDHTILHYYKEHKLKFF